MLCASGWTVFLLLGSVQYVQSGETPIAPTTRSSEDGDGLFLTPLIKKNETEKARNESRVPLFKGFGVDAFSGFITINETTKSNLFFLLVVAKGNKSDAPLLLWTQGGPGLSALFGQFLQNGPVAFDSSKNDFTQRNNTLQNNMNIIYLDLPVGAGFSFTENRTAYPKTLEDISDSVMEFLGQFLMVFPEYTCRDFYVAGESYGARYSVSIAHTLLTSTRKIPLILKGTISGNGFLGPILDTADSSEFRYWTSMVDESGRQQLSQRFQHMKSIPPQNASMIPLILLDTIFSNPPGMTPTLFQNLTSYNDYSSPLYTERPLFIQACFFFLNTSSLIRKQFHVGEKREFQYYNEHLLISLAPDYLRDISSLTERVLNDSSVLFYTGQMDSLFPSVNQRAYYRTLNWTYSKEYRNAKRSPWSPSTWSTYQGYAGFAKRVPNFTEAVLLGMSHYGAAEKPDEVYYLTMEFINSTATEG